MNIPVGFDGKAYAGALTTAPGVYRMYDIGDGLLYVGKAGNLKKRVSSYFLRPPVQPRIATLVAQIRRMEITVTRTESEALLLEAQLIKQLKPRYNILLRDDKSYPYLYLSTQDTFPRMAFHRGARSRQGRFFGPYPSTHAVRESLNWLQKLFKLRSCEDSVFRNRRRPCLQYQIGRCSAPCVGYISAQDYRRHVGYVEMFLEGRSDAIVNDLGTAMERASQHLEFESAAILRDQIQALRSLQSRNYVNGASVDMDVIAARIEGDVACVSVLFFRNGLALGSRDFFPRIGSSERIGTLLAQFIAQYYTERIPPTELILNHPPDDAVILAEALSTRAPTRVELKSRVRGERSRFLELADRNVEAALVTRLASRQTRESRFIDLTRLLDLHTSPERIECFDISHTQGEATVASCVVYGKDGPETSNYRRFNIRGIVPGDDYAAMEQALHRRFRHAAEGGQWHIPDLLLIDGGRGQVARARKVLAEWGLERIPMLGVAKGPGRRSGEEQLVLDDGCRVLHPGPLSPALQLIDAVRDEAHRFAIGGHRRKRQSVRNKSPLETIPGIGPKRRQQLLRAFGGMVGLEAAGVEEIARVYGIHLELAKRIYTTLHG